MTIIATLGEAQRALSDIREEQFRHSARVVNGVVPKWQYQAMRPATVKLKYQNKRHPK